VGEAHRRIATAARVASSQRTILGSTVLTKLTKPRTPSLRAFVRLDHHPFLPRPRIVE
jgi:hypothetical protein